MEQAEPGKSTGIQDAFARALERYQAAFGSQDIDEAEDAIHDVFALADAFADLTMRVRSDQMS